MENLKIQPDFSSIDLVPEINPSTLEAFPFDFNLRYIYALSEQKGLEIIEEVENTGTETFPIASGLHPYFNCSNLNSVRIDHPLLQEAYDRSKPSIDAVLKAPETNKLLYEDQGFSICLESDKSYQFIVLWTQPEKPFICIEPWKDKPGAFMKPQECQMIEPGMKQQNLFRILPMN